jgi:4-hydroxy-tetrahydrodipicolinate synthase
MTGPRGCGTAIVTPFADDGTVDEGALRELVAWQVEEGIDFLVPCGSTGEAQTLDDAERERVVRVTAEVAHGRAPVVAGATHNDTRRAVEETRRMCDAGADFILSACPYYNKPTQGGLVRHFEAVAAASSRPVILYNVPSRSGVNMLPATVAELAEDERIVGIKEASGDMHQALELLRVRPAGFRVYAGDDWMTLPLAASGGDGVVSVAANVVPGPMHHLARYALLGHLAEARELHERLLPLMDANFTESNPIPVKAALALMGRIHNVLRLPLVPAAHATAERLRAELAALGIPLRHRHG